MRFTIDWGEKIADYWTGDTLGQLGVFNRKSDHETPSVEPCIDKFRQVGWTRIGANLISGLSTGSSIQTKLDNAIEEIDARFEDPTAPHPDDALDHLCVVLEHFMSEVETWVKTVDEVMCQPKPVAGIIPRISGVQKN